VADTHQNDKPGPNRAYNFSVNDDARSTHSLKDGSHARDFTVRLGGCVQ
jgi:hypothetical protein